MKQSRLKKLQEGSVEVEQAENIVNTQDVQHSVGVCSEVLEQEKVNHAMYKYIHCDMFKRGVVIFIGDCDSLSKWVGKFYRDPEEQDLVTQVKQYCTQDRYSSTGVAGSCYESSSGQWLIHLPFFSFTYDPVEITNLSHEALHAAFGMLDFVGVEYRYGGSNEPYTYLHEFIFKNALRQEGYRNVR